MGNKPPYQQARELELFIGERLSQVNGDSLRWAEREALTALKHLAIDAKLDVRDWEYAETRAEQQALARRARKQLERLQQQVVRASEWNIFSATDVAQFSALAQQLISDIL